IGKSFDEIEVPAAQPTHLKVGDAGAGEIARINFPRKFGFIRVDGGGELFFHETKMKRGHLHELNPGDRAKFTIGKNQEGLTAENVEMAYYCLPQIGLDCSEQRVKCQTNDAKSHEMPPAPTPG
ncbi:unnamed protein product, partial [marine sediment metagenome]